MNLQSIAAQADRELSAAKLTADIVRAFVSNNPLPASELLNLIGAVHAAILGFLLLDFEAETAPEPEITKPTPSEIRKSITPDALISFIDGRPYKTLKRHLATHGHTPQSYRATFGLGVDYPMVSPAYSAVRSQLAKAVGLGRGGVATVQ